MGCRLELRFKEHIRYTTSNNPQTAYALYILHNAHEYGPMETIMTLLHSAQKSKRKNTSENYYIHYLHKNNMIIKEHNKKKSIIRINPQYTVPPCRRVTPPITLLPMTYLTFNQYTTPSTNHLINYCFTFHNILLIYDVLTHPYTHITLLED